MCPIPIAAKAEAPLPKNQSLSVEEKLVFAIFQKNLMGPGRMLCLNRADQDNFRQPLKVLVMKGLLVSERFAGAYSLTSLGFSVMQSTS